MKRAKIITIIIALLAVLVYTPWVYAQTVTAGQTAGGVIQQESLRRKSLSLRDRIEQERRAAEDVEAEEVDLDETAAKVLISTIQVEGATLISQSEIRSITSQYEGTEISLKGMQKVADLITDIYREKGYATSRAYIPPQTVKDGLLIIKVVEGRLGSIQFRGNRYFKTSLLEKKMKLQSAGYFDYSALQSSMVYINEHPDRTAQAVLVPGAQPGTTDVVIDVEDNYPFHVSLEADNYGSRYISNERYALVLEHNNLLGMDDKLYAKFQMTESERMMLKQFRYLFPINQDLDIGAYVVHSRTNLGKELELVDASGEALIYGVFANQTIKESEYLDLRLNLGFDYKKIKNYLVGVQSSRDEIRSLKLGVDFDALDPWGRNILTAEAHYGVPEILNGMADKDPNASRTGAGGKFQKYMFNYYRLQPMPFETSLLLKNSFQYSVHNLVASEQFQIGGPTSVRGYPPAEHSGDRGFYSAVELSVPLWGMSKYVKVPFREEKLYDSLRLVFFYDIGFVHTKTLGAGEIENNTLKGWGFGARLNVSDDLALRTEIGYPSGKTPSDSDHAHTWVEFVLKF